MCVLVNSGAGTRVESACRQGRGTGRVLCTLQRSRHEAPPDRASLRLLHGARRRRTQCACSLLWGWHPGGECLPPGTRHLVQSASHLRPSCGRCSETKLYVAPGKSWCGCRTRFGPENKVDASISAAMLALAVCRITVHWSCTSVSTAVITSPTGLSICVVSNFPSLRGEPQNVNRKAHGKWRRGFHDID